MSFFEDQKPKGFFADKWEDVVYWYEDKVEKTKMFGFWHMVADIFSTIWMNLVWQWVRKIVRVCQWIPILWNNFDWDYVYILKVLDYKLARTQKAIREGCCIQESIDKKLAEIQECRDLIRQIENCNFTEAERKAHEEKWGELKIKTVPHEDDVITRCVRLDFSYANTPKELQEQADKEMMDIHNLEDQRTQEAYSKLFSNLAKNIRNWWD